MNELTKADKALYDLGYIKCKDSDIYPLDTYERKIDDDFSSFVEFTCISILLWSYDKKKNEYGAGFCNPEDMFVFSQKFEELKNEEEQL